MIDNSPHYPTGMGGVTGQGECIVMAVKIIFEYHHVLMAVDTLRVRQPLPGLIKEDLELFLGNLRDWIWHKLQCHGTPGHEKQQNCCADDLQSVDYAVMYFSSISMVDCCSEITSLTRSPMDNMPITLSPSITGKCLKRFCVIRDMHCSTE